VTPEPAPAQLPLVRQIVPVASGNVYVWAVDPVLVIVERFDVDPANCRSPLFATTNFVTPDADAVIKSPLLVLLTMNDALLPIPPEMERGAAVLDDDPIRTPD
jgi:hypothetical protein